MEQKTRNTRRRNKPAKSVLVTKNIFQLQFGFDYPKNINKKRTPAKIYKLPKNYFIHGKD